MFVLQCNYDDGGRGDVTKIVRDIFSRHSCFPPGEKAWMNQFSSHTNKSSGKVTPQQQACEACECPLRKRAPGVAKLRCEIFKNWPKIHP